MKRILLIVLTTLVLLCSCELFYELGEPAPKVGTLRVLVYGNDYNGLPVNSLDGTVNDAVQIGNALRKLAQKADMDYQITYMVGKDPTNIRDLVAVEPGVVSVQTDVRRVTFLSELISLAAEAVPSDITIIYYAGHGIGGESILPYGQDPSADTYMVMNNSTDTDIAILAVSDFLNLVKDIAGTKVLIGDFCFSGAMVLPGGVSVGYGEYNGPDLMTLFQQRDNISEDSNLYCLSAARYYQKSYESGSHGKFTRALLEALGWNEETQTLSPHAAVEKNGCITLHNIARYVIKNDMEPKQSPMISGGSNDLVLFDFR